jgi:hypothetical protein
MTPQKVRNKCVICNGTRLEHVYTFDLFPVYMGVSDNAVVDDDIYNDMIWAICKDCGCVQLKYLVDLSILYHKGHNSGCGKTWQNHHEEFSEFVVKYCGSNILEIGGGNLKLADLVTDGRGDLNFIVVDSNCEKPDKQNITTKSAFFDYENYETEYDIDTIVHSHVLEHFYEPILVLQKFAEILGAGEKMIMSVPLLDVMIDRNFTNSLNFEHTYMLSEKILDYMVRSSGFKIVDKKLFNPYNIFVACERVPEISNLVVDDLYTKNLDLFNKFIKFHENFISEVNNMENDNLYVFGGHIFTQYLLRFGLNENKFLCVLDNDPNKIGKRLYGTNLYVESPRVLSDVKDPVVVLRAAQFSKEIKNDIIKNINSRSVFVEGRI